MSNVSYSQETINTPPATVSYEVYQRELNRRIEAERERDSLRNEIFLLRKIRRAPALKPIDSAILEEFRHVEKWGKVKDGNGNTRANYTTVARNLNSSGDTIARHAERLEKLQLIEIHEHEGPEDEHERKYVHVREERIAVIDKIKPDEKVTPKQGGNRYICTKCDSGNVDVRTITHRKTYIKCNNPLCHDYHVEKEIEDTPEDTGWKPQFGHKVQKTQKQLAFEKKEAEEQLAEHVIQIPPPVAPAFSPQDSEMQAAQFLLDIAGEHSEHIEMIPTPQKYTTVHRPLHLGDMRCHLDGLNTKGARLFYKDGTTRAITFDADTPEDWQRKKEAARLLQAMDFKPILEPSPTQPGDKHEGGGHLWIVFDAPVDAYSALQTVYQYTSNLLIDSKEHWPPETDTGNRVRLPGGKYIKPGYSAWCNLYDADGVELSRDGDGAALALLEHQTSVEVINAYEKPEPMLSYRASAPRQQGGYLEKPGNTMQSVLADIDASISWDEIADLCGGYDRRGFFPAIWRGNKPPYDVHVDPKTDKAKDFGVSAWIDKSMDKHQVLSLINGGMNWRTWKQHDLAQRCKEWEDQHGKARTICCNAPFPGDPNCSNPHCLGRQGRIAS